MLHDRPRLTTRAAPRIPDPAQPVAAQLAVVLAEPHGAHGDGMKHDPIVAP